MRNKNQCRDWGITHDTAHLSTCYGNYVWQVSGIWISAYVHLPGQQYINNTGSLKTETITKKSCPSARVPCCSLSIVLSSNNTEFCFLAFQSCHLSWSQSKEDEQTKGRERKITAGSNPYCKQFSWTSSHQGSHCSVCSQGFSLKAQSFPRALQKPKSLKQGTCRSSCSPHAGWPWHCKQHE